MLTLSNLTYRIGPRTIIENASLSVTDGWRVGVVGINGAGKSTLFKLISGEAQADGGSINISGKHRLGMVRQDIPETDTPLIDLVIGANAEMAELLRAVETEEDGNKLADMYQRLIDMDAYSAPSKAAMLLSGLGFKEHQMTEPFSSFSGGWRMRVALAAALFVEPEILLLDEPTNHLDLEAIMWLETYLLSYPHTLLIISHDRELLNKCTDHIIHVDQKQLTLYTGNYDTFERERALRLGLQQKMFEKQQAERAHMQKFVDRFRAKASKARQAQSRIKALEKMDLVDAVIAERAVQFTFPNPEKIRPPMITIDHADIGYTEGHPVLFNVNETIDPDDRIALLGANGNGKSTLMKLIAGKLNAMKGTVTRTGKLRIGYFSQHQAEELDINSTPYHEMFKLMYAKDPDVKESVVRAKLGAFKFSRDLADNRIADLSGGEKARLLFAFMSFDAPHLLLLDEPTNHLDVDAREALVQALNAYEGAIIIVSHDPSMVERVADRLWVIRDGACRPFDGDLDDYRAFTIEARRAEHKKEKQPKAIPSVDVTSPAPSNPPIKKHSAAKDRQIREIEKTIDRLAKERETLEQKMAEPGFYTSGNDTSDTQQHYTRLIFDIEQAEIKWLETQEE